MLKYNSHIIFILVSGVHDSYLTLKYLKKWLLWEVQQPSDTIQSYQDIIDYIPYDVYHVPMT